MKFVEAAAEMVDKLDGDDELRLLRLRTRKNELVIVPSKELEGRQIPRTGSDKSLDAKFLLVVIHDTPLA